MQNSKLKTTTQNSKPRGLKVALVHDFLAEWGGAERVLRVLTEMYPEAPIYTAFVRPGSEAARRFADRELRESKWAWLIRRWNLHSPFRFLIPWIWRGFDLSEYEIVITSCSSYIARGFKVGQKTKVVAYCHTPPRWLYGYRTPMNWQRFFLIRWYGKILGVFMRMFDFKTAQEVDVWLANSENVRQRIWKFYRQKAKVVYPPVEDGSMYHVTSSKRLRRRSMYQVAGSKDYYLVVARLVGGKGLIEAARACKELGLKLKIAGKSSGFSKMEEQLEKLGAELLGFVSDENLGELYARAKGFIALAKDEDFGMTVVEAMMMGTPVLAYAGGGFLETVKDGETGVLVKDTSVEAIGEGLRRMERIKWDRKKLQQWARNFSRERFEKEIYAAVRQ